MALIDLITLLQHGLPLILPVSLNLVLIFLGLRQAKAGTRTKSKILLSVEPSSTDNKIFDFVRGTSQPRPQATRFKPVTKHELELFLEPEPPLCTERKLYKINRHIRLFVKMLNDFEKHAEALERFSPTVIDDTVFDSVTWELCLTKGFLFDLFGPDKAYVEQYLSVEEEPDEYILQSLYSSELVTHKVVCVPRRGSEMEGVWGLNDEFLFQRMGRQLPHPEHTHLAVNPLNRCFWCTINGQQVWQKVLECDFFLEQIDPNREFEIMNSYISPFSPEEVLRGVHEEVDSEGEDELY